MSEAGEAKRDGATLQANSGRGVVQKGDALLHPFCVDYKEYRESFSVSVKGWAKCTSDAFQSRSQPAFKLVLGPDDAKVRLWVVSDRMFHEMREAWLEKYDEDKI